MVATDERYLQMQNGKFFSTGNHPVETLLPMLHIHKAGFEIDVAPCRATTPNLKCGRCRAKMQPSPKSTPNTCPSSTNPRALPIFWTK